MNGGNDIFCFFCVFYWDLVDICWHLHSVQYKTFPKRFFRSVLWMKYWNVSNWLYWLLNGTDDIAIFGQCWQQGFGKQPVQCWQQLQRLQGCQQSIACRHILTVIKITPTTCSLWQWHHHWPMSSAGIESVLCVIVNMAEKQIAQFPKKKRNS